MHGFGLHFRTDTPDNGGMNPGDIRTSAYQGVKWAAVASYSTRLVRLAVLFVMMGLLGPEEFGLLGIASIVLAITSNFSELGVGQALIWHRGKHSDRDPALAMDTGLILVMALNLTVIALMMAGAPLISAFFQEPRATPVTRVLLIGLFLSTLTIVPRSMLERNLQFKAAVWPEVLPGIVSGLVSIPLAIVWRSVWALVAGQMVSYALRLALYWWTARWRPRLRFDRETCREMLGFGLSVLGASLIATVGGIFPPAVIGREVGTEALGVFNNAEKISAFPFFAIIYVVGRVMFPVYSRLREDSGSLRTAVAEAIKLIAVASVPLCIGGAVIFPALELQLFDGKWHEMYVPLLILMLYVLQRSVGSVTGDVLKAVGRPNLIQLLTLLRVGVTIPAVLAGVWLAGLNGAALGMLLAGTVSLVAELRIQRRFVNLGVAAVADAVKVPVAAGCLSAAVAAAFTSPWLFGPTPAGLIGGVASGALVYLWALAHFERSLLRDVHASIFGKRATAAAVLTP